LASWASTEASAERTGGGGLGEVVRQGVVEGGAEWSWGVSQHEERL